MPTIPNTRSVNQAIDVAQPPLARLAGPFALAAGTLIILQQLVMVSIVDRSQLAATMAHPLFVPSAIAYVVAFCGLLIALVAIYTWQANRAGIFGVIGFVAALVGTLFLAGDAWFEAFVVPWLADVAPEVIKSPVPFGLLMIGAFASYVLFAVGWALFALASLRARAFPAAISIAILVGGVVGFYALVPPFALPLGMAITWLGVWMLRTARAASTNAEPALC
jgi:hypothetical protein